MCIVLVLKQHIRPSLSSTGWTKEETDFEMKAELISPDLAVDMWQ